VAPSVRESAVSAETVEVELDVSRPIADLALSSKDASFGVLLSACAAAEAVGSFGASSPSLEHFVSLIPVEDG